MEQKKHRRKRSLFKTGEDIEMLREKNEESKRKRKLPICDTHIDGA